MEEDEEGWIKIRTMRMKEEEGTSRFVFWSNNQKDNDHIIFFNIEEGGSNHYSSEE